MRGDRFQGISMYVHATHALLVLAALIAPAVAVMIGAQTHIGQVISVVLLSLLVATGGALGIALDFIPWHSLLRPFSTRNRRVILSVTVVIAAFFLLLLLSATDNGISVAALPMALALRSISGGSFWSGIARMFTVSVACGVLLCGVVLTTGQLWEPLALALVIALLFAFGLLGQDSIYTLAIELDDLRTLEADRAVASERQRLAGDLHDIQGQHLGLITVEAELVTKLLAIGDAPGAASHARRLQTVAADALGELHRVVHDTRAVSLDQEVTNAAGVLQAAGITVSVEMSEINRLPAPSDRLLGLTVRESITNILKHSRARNCTIRVAAETRHDQEGVALTVVDSGPAAHNSVHASGTGLAMLRERYREVGGEIAILFAHGATLTAWIPAPKEFQ